MRTRASPERVSPVEYWKNVLSIYVVHDTLFGLEFSILPTFGGV